MGIKTKIEWCDSTINPIMGCTGCALRKDHCYAAALCAHYAGRKGWPKSFDQPEFFPGRLEKYQCIKLARNAPAECLADALGTECHAEGLREVREECEVSAMIEKAFTFGSLFAGIGGIDLGLERAGMTCRWQVEIDPDCQRWLAYHWPDVRRYGDVRTIGKHNLKPTDLICGGFPCQPHSVAGKRKGAEDDRNLWPEFIRIVREMRPRYILAENVPGIVSTYLDTVLSDLEGEAYTCWTFNIPACALDAPHRRERIFIVAHTEQHSHRPEEFCSQIGEADTTGPTSRTGRPGDGGRKANVAHAEGQRARDECKNIGQASREIHSLDDTGCFSRGANQSNDREVVAHDDIGAWGDGEVAQGGSRNQIGRSQESSRGCGSYVADTQGQQRNGSDDYRGGRCRPLSQSGDRAEETRPLGGRGGIEPGLGMLADGIPPGLAGLWLPEPPIGRIATGIPNRVAKLRALGNAVVPQVAEWIGRRIMEFERMTNLDLI